MDKDFKSAKHEYNANSYLEMFETEMAPIFEELDIGYQFIQNNVFIHYVYKIKVWFQDHNIPLIKNWPLYSFDLNLIEYI